jgi:hypothetical protein
VRCAFSVALFIVGWGSLLPAAAENETGLALRPNLMFADRQSVHRAVHLAIARLARPSCAAIFEEFLLPDGRTVQSELDRRAIGPREFVQSLLFVDGSRATACQNGRSVLITTPGSLLIRVCPGFAQLSSRRLASLVIHEALHALGLGEDPPSSRDITNRVERRCW